MRHASSFTLGALAFLLIAFSLPLGAQAATGTNLIPNPSVTDGDVAAGTVAGGWTTQRAQANSPTFQYLPQGYKSTGSLRVDMNSFFTGDAYWTYPQQPVAGGKAYLFSDMYMSNVLTEVNMVVTHDDGTTSWHWVGEVPASADWRPFVAHITMPKGAVSAAVYHSLAKPGQLTTDAYVLAEYTPEGFSEGLVSITFDGGIASTYQNAFPPMKTLGLPATHYIITEHLEDSYHINLDMLKNIKAAGHEIASHTVTHADLTTLTPAERDDELNISQTILRDRLLTRVSNFASPFGRVDDVSLGDIQNYYRSHRSTTPGFNSKDSFDIFNIRVQNVLATTTPEEVATWVQQAKKDKTWLVLVYQSVDDPEVAKDALWNTTPVNLATELNMIAQSGITVVTVEQALNIIEDQLK